MIRPPIALAGLALAGVALAQAPARAAEGLITLASSHPVKETVDRLEATLKGQGATIFARVDHAAGAASVNLPLRPTVVLIFGNPKGGTPLMQSKQTAGIDLPQKALVYEDEAGRVWLAYNDPAWIAARHNAGIELSKVTAAVTAALKAATEAATAP